MKEAERESDKLITKSMSPTGTITSLLTAVLVAIIGGGWVACDDTEPSTQARSDSLAKSGAKSEAKRGTRVVLVTLDTLRLDSFGGEGTPGAMPLTREWARKGLVFNRHYASSSTTQPTHASLLTGLHPWQHGVSRNGQVLADEYTTLAEVFARNGFHTGAVVSSFPLHESFGFDQGFERYDDAFDIQLTMEWSGTAVPGGAFYSLGESITNKALAMIDQLEGPRQFLWFHYFDLHEPYGDAARRGGEIQLAEIYDRIERGDPRAGSLVEQARERYDADAQALDRRLDRLFRRLFRDAEQVDTHLLVVSDHGESFGELGSLGHGKRLSEELIHVPGFLLSPEVEPGIVEVSVGSVDVPVTLLSLAGLSGLVSSGQDLTQPLREERSVYGMRRTFEKPFSELRMDGQRHRLEDLMFFVAGSDVVTTGNAREIFTGAGAGPERNKARAVFELFESELTRSSSATDLDPESRAALEALGYVQ
jgi:arylsulfatase A-like enzyme